MAMYDDDFKLNAVQRIENGETQKNVAADLGVSAATLANWRRAFANNAQSEAGAKGVTSDAKLEHVAATYKMDEAELERYTAEHNLSVSALEDWRERAAKALSDRSQGDFDDPIAAMNQAMQQLKRDNQRLQDRLDKIKNI